VSFGGALPRSACLQLLPSLPDVLLRFLADAFLADFEAVRLALSCRNTMHALRA
jgi:hypothetical protein